VASFLWASNNLTLRQQQQQYQPHQQHGVPMIPPQMPPQLEPQLSFESPRPQGPKRVTPTGRHASRPGTTGAAQRHGTAAAAAAAAAAADGKHVRFAETREAQMVAEMLGGGGGRRPLGERYVNRMVSARDGNPTSHSTEEAKLLASLHRLDAHCLAIPAAAAVGPA
jgi:hypothetical protein